MKDAGHRQTIEAALNMEKTDRTPVNNFALVTAARSAGIMVKDARYEPKVSAKVSVDYALKTKSDFVKPVVDSQIVFLDMGMDVQMPDDDYGRVRSKYINDISEIDDLAFFDPSKASECPHFDLCILQALKETEKYLPE
ncbi:MAG: methyltransferase/corrinoid binding protein, partial [Candidatus Methanomethylophilus sp.]|nr:methyltransferase/corrinoid binding protein [Methanomethylophilus sp.]